MQEYSNPKSRNLIRAAGGMMKNAAAMPGSTLGAPVGSNQQQGKGEIPGKVSVPMPGTNETQPAQTGGMKSGNVPGFSGGIINGMV